MDPELEKYINRRLQFQNGLNMRVEGLVQENHQVLASHAKFKQLIGYRDKNAEEKQKKGKMKL